MSNPSEKLKELVFEMLAVLEKCDPGPEQWPLDDSMHDGGVFCELSVSNIRDVRAVIAKAKEVIRAS
jgi:hypothetical protein